MSELVKELRQGMSYRPQNWSGKGPMEDWENTNRLMADAANEIERLREVIKDYERRQLSLELLERKLAHGCLDVPCSECETENTP